MQDHLLTPFNQHTRLSFVLSACEQELMKGLEEFVGRQYPKGLVWASSTTCTLSLTEAMQAPSLPIPAALSTSTHTVASISPTPSPTPAAVAAPPSTIPAKRSEVPQVSMMY